MGLSQRVVRPLFDFRVGFLEGSGLRFSQSHGHLKRGPFVVFRVSLTKSVVSH